MVNKAAEVMQEVERLCASMDLFTEKSLCRRRGEFLSISSGVSFGGGQKVRAQFKPLIPIEKLHATGAWKPSPY